MCSHNLSIELGTLINTAAVAAGGLIGLCLKNGLKRQMQEILIQAYGVATIFIGAAGALSKMLVIGEEGITTTGTMLLIFSLVQGGIAGEWLDMEQKMDGLGEKIKRAVKARNDSLFVEGFVNVSLIICVGVNIAFRKKFRVGISAARSARAGFVPFGEKPGGHGLARPDSLQEGFHSHLLGL